MSHDQEHQPSQCCFVSLNGTFSVFGNRNQYSQVIICKDEMDLFPGQDEKFVGQDLQDKIYNSILEMAKRSGAIPNHEVLKIHHQTPNSCKCSFYLPMLTMYTMNLTLNTWRWNLGLDIQLPMQSVPITTDVVSLNLDQDEVYNIMW
jgi:hypothetical protein